jgi:hypothetical protein
VPSSDVRSGDACAVSDKHAGEDGRVVVHRELGYNSRNDGARLQV